MRAVRQIVRGSGRFLGQFQSVLQRGVALFLFVVLTFNIVAPPVTALAATVTTSSQASTTSGPGKKNVTDPHAKPADPRFTTSDQSFNQPPAMPLVASKLPAAVDAAPAAGTDLSLAQGVAAQPGDVPHVVDSGKTTPHELVDRRTANSDQTVNSDGSITQKDYIDPKYFQQNNQWVPIDTGLQEDLYADDPTNIVASIWDTVQSWFTDPQNYIEKANSWQVRFSATNFPQGMVRIKQGSDQVGFAPVNANTVKPDVTTDDSGQQIVRYTDVWPGVDLEYRVSTDTVKENIILKNKNAANSVAFTIIGANLNKQMPDASTKIAPYYQITGALNDAFGIAAPNLILNNSGMVTDGSILTQAYANGTLTTTVDPSYLQSLPDAAFPAVIDPTTFSSTFGTRVSGKYVSLKSDGYVCPSTTCNPYAGALYDSTNTLRYWRSAFYAPYDQFKTSGNNLVSASLHLVQRTNAGYWTGGTSSHTFYVGHATCTNNFNCLDGNAYNDSGSLATSGNIDVTNIYAARLAAHDYGAWLMLGGEDGTTSSFKEFDPGTGTNPPNGSYVSFTYGGPPVAPSFVTPTTDNQVFVTTQPSFRVNKVDNPNSTTVPLRYEMVISTGSGMVGALVDSGVQDSTQWTPPDSILQDGSTYYIQARSFDPVTSTYSGWNTSIPFRVDLRTGKDKTQTYDTIGPVSVDLATGNVTTSVSSHSSAALGGNLGISLTYNSPLRSRNGLVGRYWNVATNYSGGLPTSAPNVTRVDQNIDFNWNTGSPSAGTLNNDWVYAAWDGYLTVPKTDTYYFGGTNDDIFKITVNGTLLYSSNICSTRCYGSSMTLQANQLIPIHVEYQEKTSTAYATMYIKDSTGADQVVPTDWLQTGVRPVASTRGLTGSYYGRFDGTNTFSSANYMIMRRTDQTINFNWGANPPVTNGPNDFLIRWTGYVTVPTTGSYTFGTNSDDGSKVMLGNSNTVVYSDWNTHPATEGYGSGYSLTANTPTKITIEYYDQGGSGASFQLKVKVPGSSTGILVPSEWLSTTTQVLPDGWDMGLDPDGNVSYNRIKINQSTAVLTDSTGDTHEYTWTGSSYKPPVNEDGVLTRNADGTFTLVDTDGRTYVFATDGTLTSVTSPADDRHPAALQYTYGIAVTNGPTTLLQITDPVDTSRWAKLYYSGQSQCGSIPTGFSATPANELCALQTNDGRTTYFYYNATQLARVAQPGGANTDFQYESVLNNGVTVGLRMNAIRDPLAMDAVGAGIRADDDTTKTQLGYDGIGRVISVTAPAATAGATRQQATFEYLVGVPSDVDQNGNLIPGYAGLTKEHIAGAAEPNGYSRQVKYDYLFRTIEDTDVQGLATTMVWDQYKDLLLSTTGPTGLMSTTIYDDEDRPTDSYGPAPAAWFGSDRVPTSSYLAQVPHTRGAYDETISGPAVAWFNYAKQTGNSGLLTGAPKLHATGINTATPGILSYDFANPPITADSGMQGIGLSATGKLRLPTGTYTISADTSDGIKAWVDDQVVLDQWVDGSYRTVTGTAFTISDSTPKRLRIDVYRRTGSTGTLNVKIAQTGGFAATTDWSSYLKPDYSLATSATVYDSTLGNGTATTNYGSNPELGLAQSSTVDPSGLNLTSSSTYETPGASGSFLRQTSASLPGNPSTDPDFSYTYYGATETRQNPCNTAQTFKQAGMLKFKTEASPDNGTTPGRVTEYVYDDAGNVVASRYNSDAWTCTTYDSRGRVSSVTVPAYNGELAHTISYDYALGGNPLQVAQTDTTTSETLSTSTTVDLLGRTVSYSDVNADTTTTSYDSLGRVSQTVSPVGTEVFNYDSYNRLTSEVLDGTTYANVYYDQYGRVDHFTYPNAGQQALWLGRDSLGRTSSETYYLGDGTSTISDTLNLTQSNRVTTDQVQSGSASLWSQYVYDAAGRLTSAGVGTHSYTYGFGTQDASCGSGSNMNPNAGKDGNRTTQTIDGVTTTYCYDYADRLVSSSNPAANGAVYDSHGNTTQIGTTSSPLRLYYDSLDRNYGLENYDASGNGSAIYYDHDASGRLVYREHDTISAFTWNLDAQAFYGYTGPGDSPDFIRSATGTITDKYLQLPGGVMVDIKPQQTGNAAKQYTLPSIEGRTLLTLDAAGTNTSTGSGPLGSFAYDPFGNAIGALPANAQNGSYGYGGSLQKMTETTLALMPIQMGARVYFPTLGRFASVDPIDGGTPNRYSYVLDPINGSDYSGMCSGIWGCIVAFFTGGGSSSSAAPPPTGGDPQFLKMLMSGWLKTTAGTGTTQRTSSPATPSPLRLAVHLVLNLAAVPPYAAYYYARRARHAIVQAVPAAKYTPLNVLLLATEAGGLAGDAAIDRLKGESMADENGEPGCTQPFHTYFGPCGPKLPLYGIRPNGSVDW